MLIYTIRVSREEVALLNVLYPKDVGRVKLATLLREIIVKGLSREKGSNFRRLNKYMNVLNKIKVGKMTTLRLPKDISEIINEISKKYNVPPTRIIKYLIKMELWGEFLE